MSDNRSSVSVRACPTFGTILFFIFLVLKLTGKIGWSWWWVTAPLWIGWGIAILLVVLMLVIVAAASRV